MSAARLDRREVLKWIASATAAISVRSGRRFPQDPVPPAPAAAPPSGYGTDPVLNRSYEPGAFWPLEFDEDEQRLAAALSDLIIPADDRSLSASEVGVVDFVDEWISAPYPRQQSDCDAVRAGFAWLEAQAQARFGKRFAALAGEAQRAICDPICSEAGAAPELAAPAAFFALYRNLVAGAFYSTRPGMQDVGYVGNTAKPQFDGPPPEVLQKLGLQ